ncbi:hypothetical protein [Singulisphaera sp. PoT]|uniref:hypothetical protein n=1 Tax=Singulisphaera sp. PoT TaxID=3411797 RepID=UPI003BF4E6D8
MYLEFFHQASMRVFRGRRDKRGHDSLFGHTFGGSADYEGLSAAPDQPPVHLLLRLNTDDPAVGVSIPGVRWLPLLCAIRYGACDLGYRVVSDREVKILHQAESKAWEDFPYEGYPGHILAAPLTLAEWEFDPSDPEHAFFYAGVFGLDALSAGEHAAPTRPIERQEAQDIFGQDIAEAYAGDDFAHPFDQAPPAEDCPDPECPSHHEASSLRTFAIFREARAEARNLWGPHCANLQIVYRICPTCSAIRTSNSND